jgi:hypothetical protein
MPFCPSGTWPGFLSFAEPSPSGAVRFDYCLVDCKPASLSTALHPHTSYSAFLGSAILVQPQQWSKPNRRSLRSSSQKPINGWCAAPRRRHRRRRLAQDQEAARATSSSAHPRTRPGMQPRAVPREQPCAPSSALSRIARRGRHDTLSTSIAPRRRSIHNPRSGAMRRPSVRAGCATVHRTGAGVRTYGSDDSNGAVHAVLILVRRLSKTQPQAGLVRSWSFLRAACRERAGEGNRCDRIFSHRLLGPWRVHTRWQGRGVPVPMTKFMWHYISIREEAT